MKSRLIGWLAGGAAALPLAAYLILRSQSQPLPDVPSADSVDPGKGPIVERSRVVCSGCHLHAPPDVLPKRSWGEVLDQMGVRMGLAEALVSEAEKGKDSERATRIREFRDELKRVDPGANPPVLPESPLIEEREFRAIRERYLAEAPENPLPQGPRVAVNPVMTRFELASSLGMDSGASEAVTLVRLEEGGDRAFSGGMTIPRGGKPEFYLTTHDAMLGVKRRYELPSPPVSLDMVGDILYVVTIGNLQTSQGSEAAIHLFEPDGKGGYTQRPLLQNLVRSAGASVADLDDDGIEDILFHGFGYHVGKLSAFLGLDGGGYEERVLHPQAGAMASEVGDLDGDGQTDFMTLFAQHHETLFLFLNEGEGIFQKRTLIQRHPAFGFSSFALSDFNDDGMVDVVTTNGDNGDYFDAPLKPYHGVRIFLNRGDFRFEEAWFQPMHGAFKVVPADYDEDGDTDLAVIARDIDPAQKPRENFVYFENDGMLSYSAYVMPELESTRFLTMDAGDVDGDGDLDLVLGGRSRTDETGRRPQGQRRLTLLRNTIR